MRHGHHNTPSSILRQPGWADALAETLGLTDYSDDLPRALVAKCLLVAAALRTALSAVARTVAGLGRETLRKAVAGSLPKDPRRLEDRLAAGLRHALPRELRRVPIPIAIDIHRRPYYGDRDTPGISGGKAEAGARWFWSYATAVSLEPGHRHTRALTAVGPSDTLTNIVERLLMQVSWSGVLVRYVLLDRAFYAAGVVRVPAVGGLEPVDPCVVGLGENDPLTQLRWNLIMHLTPTTDAPNPITHATQTPNTQTLTTT